MFINLTVDIVVDMIIVEMVADMMITVDMIMPGTIIVGIITVRMIMQLTIIQNTITVIVKKRNTTTGMVMKDITMEQEDAVDTDTTMPKN